MNTYNVHLYREMRLFFPGIVAKSVKTAARIAAGKPTDDAQTVEDCEGVNIAALVDVEGDTEYRKSRTIDFQPQIFLDTLLNIKRLAGKSGDHEADPFALLDLIATEALAAIRHATKE
jgi:hypothetical protein